MLCLLSSLLFSYLIYSLHKAIFVFIIYNLLLLITPLKLLLNKDVQGVDRSARNRERKHCPNAFMAVPVSWVSVKVLS